MDTARYADLFLTESREHLSAINHSLLELERAPGSSAPVEALFRAVHTVKGMSATMGYTPVADLSHELESLLDRVRKGEQRIGPAVMDALFAAADALEQAVERAVAGRQHETNVAPLVARLRALTNAGVGTPASAAADTETSAPNGPWTVSAPSGAGMLVRVRLVEGTPLRGVRAFLIIQKARTLGDVTATAPSIEALQAEEFELDFAFRLSTAADAATVERTLRTAGDVDRLEVAGASRETADASAGAEATVAKAAMEAAASRPQRHVRIDLRRLDALMNLIGELVITRGRLAQIASRLGDPALDEALGQASRLVSDLQDEIMTSRMVPVWQVFDRFPRLVRDVARSLGKQVEFSVEGKEIELDRSMLDEIGDPIVHLLRNSIDHGIESPEERVASGKPAQGRLVLSAVRDRSAVLIRVSDDGKGIDRAKVLRRAKEQGLVDATKQDLSDDELIRLISRSGFSTADRVSEISGRGVGIDAVQARVRGLGGTLEIRSTPGAGTTVTVRLPLTLAIVRALLARVAEETYALPLTHVSETVELTPASLRKVKGREVLVLREDVLPLQRLRETVQLPADAAAARQVVIIEVADKRVGLVVDELAGQQEIVVKQFDAVRDGLSIFSGATILGDGNPALILDVSSFI